MIQIKSDQIAYMSPQSKTCHIAVAKKTSIDKPLFVQFISAVRQSIHLAY